MHNAASTSILFQAYQLSDAFGKLIFLGLLALSIICWAVLAYKAWQLYTMNRLAARFYQVIEKKKVPILSLSLDDVPTAASTHLPNPFLSLLRSVRAKSHQVLEKNRSHIEKSDQQIEVSLTAQDLESIEHHLDVCTTTQVKKLGQYLFLLPMIISLAPFLGILGTVWGILVSLSHMQMGQGPSNAAILSGITTALATTVFGLVIAIPALIGYNYLKNALHHIEGELDQFSFRLLTNLEHQYRKVEL